MSRDFSFDLLYQLNVVVLPSVQLIAMLCFSFTQAKRKQIEDQPTNGPVTDLEHGDTVEVVANHG